MSTYRERREAKAARYREWADKRETKSDAAFDKAQAIQDTIPFGQPILVGHHSEGRHRRDLDRIDSSRRAAIEHADKADTFRSRADEIERQAARAIYSDDPDAIEALEQRIARLEAERDRIKAYNASCRKGAPDLSLLDEAQQRSLASIAKVAPYQLGKKGEYPGYALSNLSGDIGRQRKRLALLQAKAARNG